MFIWFNHNRWSRFVLGITLLVSFTSYSLPLRAFAFDIIGVSPKVESVAKLIKLADKLKKLKSNSDKKESYKLARKIKKEIEELSGKKLSYSKGIKEVEALFKKKGINVSHAQFKAIQEDIKEDKHKSNSKPGAKEEIDVPIHVTVGVVMCLCSIFLAILPIPGCKEAAAALMTMGAGFAGTKICDKHEENKQKEREKNRKYVYFY